MEFSVPEMQGRARVGPAVAVVRVSGIVQVFDAQHAVAADLADGMPAAALRMPVETAGSARIFTARAAVAASEAGAGFSFGLPVGSGDGSYHSVAS